MINALIIDDEPAIGSIIKDFIEADQLPITIIGCARNGTEGLDMIIKRRPYFVFLDIRMPDITGLEIMEKVKDYGFTDVNFFIITGYSLFEYAQSALRLGAKDIFLKPLDLKQFRESIISNLGFEYTNNYLVNNLLFHIKKHYSENITLQDAAENLFVSPQYLSRIFKRVTGLTFNKYLNVVRISNAKDLLLHSDMSIQQVATNVGYPHVNNFYVQFKASTGVTPLLYQKNHYNALDAEIADLETKKDQRQNDNEFDADDLFLDDNSINLFK